MKRSFATFLVFCGFGLVACKATASDFTPLIYTGAADGSAAVAVDAEHFATASDEDSTIRIYHRNRGGAPLWSINLTRFLEVDNAAPETDIEAGARIADRAYWISSHGRNQHGHERPDLRRFFATDIKTNGALPQLVPVGRPYKNLLADLALEVSLAPFKLAEAAGRAPKSPGALSIEGLCATPDDHLLVGFRNPVPQGRALAVPLLNPAEVIHGQRAKFGPPIRLNLGGLGIRDLAYWGGRYLIIAGPSDGKGQSHLYEWKGGKAEPKLLKHIHLKGLNPEAVVVYPDKGWDEFQLLSDDSKEQKKGLLVKPGGGILARQFRNVWIKK